MHKVDIRCQRVPACECVKLSTYGFLQSSNRDLRGTGDEKLNGKPGRLVAASSPGFDKVGVAEGKLTD